MNIFYRKSIWAFFAIAVSTFSIQHEFIWEHHLFLYFKHEIEAFKQLEYITVMMTTKCEHCFGERIWIGNQDVGILMCCWQSVVFYVALCRICVVWGVEKKLFGYSAEFFSHNCMMITSSMLSRRPQKLNSIVSLFEFGYVFGVEQKMRNREEKKSANYFPWNNYSCVDSKYLSLILAWYYHLNTNDPINLINFHQ